MFLVVVVVVVAADTIADLMHASRTMLRLPLARARNLLLAAARTRGRRRLESCRLSLGRLREIMSDHCIDVRCRGTVVSGHVHVRRIYIYVQYRTCRQVRLPWLQNYIFGSLQPNVAHGTCDENVDMRLRVLTSVRFYTRLVVGYAKNVRYPISSQWANKER